MAAYYVDPTSGNNANAGTLASPWKTIARALATSAFSPLVTSGDIIYLRGHNGNHVLTAGVSNAQSALVITAYPGDPMPVIQGNFGFSLTGGGCTINGLWFQGTSGSHISGSKWAATNCIFKPLSGTSSAGVFSTSDLLIKNCIFENKTGNTITVQNNVSVIRCFDSVFKNVVTCVTPNTADNVPMFLSGNIFNFCTSVINLNTRTAIGWIDFEYNDVYNCTNFITGNASSNVTISDSRISRNYFDLNSFKMVTSPGSFSITVTTNLNENNLLKSTVSNLIGWNSLNDSAIIDPKFYAPGSDDFRIEYDSPLALYNGDAVGAKVLESFTTFFDILAQSDVKNGVSYKAGSRTANMTGSYVAAGETDPDKVLNTSILISGNYIPVIPANVRAGTSFGLSQTGLLNLPTVGNVRSGINFDNGTKTGLLDLPSVGNVEFGIQFDQNSKTGTYTGANRWTVPTDDKIMHGEAVKRNNVSSVGTYRGYDLFDIVLANELKLGVSKKQDGSTVVGTLVEENTDNIAANELKIGVTKIVKGSSVTGTYKALERNVFPANNKILEGEQYKEDNVDKVGSLHIKVSTDPGKANVKVGNNYIFEDVAQTAEYSPDFPAPNETIEGATTDNQPGTVILPPEEDVRQGEEYGPDGSLTGSATVDKPSSPPSQVIPFLKKGTTIILDGEEVEGQWDTGDDGEFEELVTKFTVLQKIQSQILGIGTQTHSKFDNRTIKTSIDENLEGLSDQDYPYVKIENTGTTTDVRYMNASIPVITMKVKLTVFTPPSWNAKEQDSYYEDIRQSLLYGNYTLDGVVQWIKAEGEKPVQMQHKPDQIRQAEMLFQVRFVEQILEN